MEKLAFTAMGERLKTVLIKEELVGASRWPERLNFSAAILSLIYLTITNSIVSASNIIFANIMVGVILIRT
jgi:hypothetical protein